MIDRFGRDIEYLRISVTQKCNLKCIYCRPNDGKEAEDALPDDGMGRSCGRGDHEWCGGMMTPAEFGLITRAMVSAGIRKIRITGGEPLLRPDICEIIRAVSQVEGIDDVSMTTNGILLAEKAERLKAAGLMRVNISLDSLKEDSFKYITGNGSLKRVLLGINKALEVGLTPVKINTVLIKGINDGEIDDIIGLAKDLPVDVRFIELMPIGDFGEENAENIVYSSDIVSTRTYLKKLRNVKDRQPAEYFKIEGYKGRIGFISPMGHKFCAECNRIRLTCDGKIKLCLGDNTEVDILETLRGVPERLEEFIKNVVFLKPAGHNFERSFNSSRNMSAIGG